MLTRSAAPILLCCFLFGSSLQAPRLIPATEDCPDKCVCTIKNGMMSVDCLMDDEFRALEKPSPEKDLNVQDEVELVKPLSNSDTAPEETTTDDPQAFNASVEEEEKSKQQNVSEPRIVIESALAVDVVEEPNQNEIMSDEEMMQADEQHSDNENQSPSDDQDKKEGEKELPESLVSDPDSKVVAKKGTHLHLTKEEEWQGDQPAEESYEEYEEEDEENKPEEKKLDEEDNKKTEERGEVREEDKQNSKDEDEDKQRPEKDNKPSDKTVSIEETVQNEMDAKTESADVGEINNDEEKDTVVGVEQSMITPLDSEEQAVETKENAPTRNDNESQAMKQDSQASESEEEEELSAGNENKNAENENEEPVRQRNEGEDVVEGDGNKSIEKVKPLVVADDEEINIKEKDEEEETIDPIVEDMEKNSDKEISEEDEALPLTATQSKQSVSEEGKPAFLEDEDTKIESNEEEREPSATEDNDTKSSNENEEEINNKEIRMGSEEIRKVPESDDASEEKETSKEKDTDSDLFPYIEVNGNPIVTELSLDVEQDGVTTPILPEEETTEKDVVDKMSENKSEIEPPNILIVKPDLTNETDSEKNGTDMILTRDRQNPDNEGLDNILLPNGEILVTGNIDDTKTGKIIDEQDEEITETTQPQQSTASWVILGLILGTFVVVLGYAAIRGSINKKKEAEITTDSKTSNSIPPVFDSKFTRKPDYETGTELKELSRPFLQSPEKPVREYKDKKDELHDVVVNDDDRLTSMPYIDAPNPLMKLQRPNAPPPLDLPAPNDTSRHDSTTTSPSPEPSAPELQQHTPTTPSLVRTRIVDNSPQVPRMIANANEYGIKDD